MADPVTTPAVSDAAGAASPVASDADGQLASPPLTRESLAAMTAEEASKLSVEQIDAAMTATEESADSSAEDLAVPVVDAEAKPDEPPPDPVAEWVKALEDNVATIARVPQKQLPTVLKAYEAQWTATATTAMQMAYQQGLAAGKQGSTVESSVAKIDALFDAGDLDLYREELAKFPGGERAYHRAKAELTPVPESSPEHFQNQANQLFANARLTPDEAAVFQRNWNYAAAERDMGRLEADLKAVVRARSNGNGTRPDPDQQAVARRSENVSRLKETPKAEVTAGGADGGPLTRARLAQMSPEAISKIPMDTLNKVLAAT